MRAHTYPLGGMRETNCLARDRRRFVDFVRAKRHCIPAGMTTRTEPIRILLVEDSDDDAELVLRELKRCGFDVTANRVQTEPALESALAESYDVVLCDYTM